MASLLAYTATREGTESSVIKKLCALAGIQKTQTTPYHLMGNGSVERFNQTLLNMLGTLEDRQKDDWRSFVAPLVHSPYFLMLGATLDWLLMPI